MTAVADRPTRRLVCGFGMLGTLAVLFVLAGTGNVGTVAAWVLGAELLADLVRWLTTAVVVVVLAAVAYAARGSSRSASAHVHGGRRATVIRHEALGHAAVAHGVGAGRIRARLTPGGGGEVTCDVSRMSPAEYVAFMRAGLAVAGAPGDCRYDLAKARRELDCLPADQRDRVSRDADRIVARYVGSPFGHRVAEALRESGRFG